MSTSILLTQSGDLQLNSYFSLFNVTITCQLNSWDFIDVECSDHNLPQFFTIDPDCNGEEWSVSVKGCGQVFNTTDKIDNDTLGLVETISSLVDYLVDTKEKCRETNDNLFFGTGYPLQVDQQIVNNAQNGDVCCLGDRSCSHAKSIRGGNFGNIICGGHESCANVDLLWTQGVVSSANSYSFNNMANIYCGGADSCLGSILDCENNIICGASGACQDSVILNAQVLYCMTANGCTDILVKNVQNIYMIEQQLGVGGVTIYSGNDGNDNMKIIFKSKNSGNDVTYYCEENDICLIKCDFQACNNSTRLYCFGKCNVNCDTNIPNNTCPQIVSSREPTTAPTAAPSDMPTYSPTDDSENLLITEKQISDVMNTLLIIIGVLVTLVIVMGYVRAWCIGESKNELFNWTAILFAGFYCSDFFSDILFCVRLCVVSFEDQDGFTLQLQSKFFILFVLSFVFIIVPFFGSIVPLHFEISKWSKDKVLKHAAIPQWTKKNAKLLYLLSVVTGSSFSAVALCNSYLLTLNAFSMGLSQYHRSIFQNKRFFCVVILEVCCIPSYI